jgi:hypothetical protein
MMALPRGTFKGLAKVTAPLWFWMAAGWAAYPRMIEFITDRMGESLDMAEVEVFSMAMVAACIAAGIALAAYGYLGREADDSEVSALGAKPALCPFCSAVIPEGAEQCPGCKRKVLK